MFQNIDGVAKAGFKESNATDAVYDKNTHIKQILADVLSINNICLYILAFLISCKWITFEYALIGFSFVVACLSAGIPLIGVLISTLIGTFIGHGLSGGIAFIAMMLIFMIITVLFRPKVATSDRNEGVKLGSRLVIACLLILTIKDIGKASFFNRLFFAFIDTSIVYAFYKVFVNGIVIVRDIFDKKVYTVEEYLSLVSIITFAFCLNFRGTEYSKIGLFIQGLITAFVLMWISLKNHTLVSLLAGLVAGLTIILINVGFAKYVVVYMIACLLASCFVKFSKNNWIKKILCGIGFAAGAYFTNFLITRGEDLVNLEYVFSYLSTALAFVLLMLVPANANIEVEDLIGKIKLITDFKDNRLKPVPSIKPEEEVKTKKITINNSSPKDNKAKNQILESGNDNLQSLDDLFDIEDSFNEIIKEFDNSTMIDDTKKEELLAEQRKEDFVQDFLDNIEDINNNILYEELSKNEAIVNDCYDVLLKDSIIGNNDFVKIMESYNNYIYMRDDDVREDVEDVIIILNRTYKNLK